MIKAFVSWSGGKECNLSYYKAMQDKNVEVMCLLNMVTEDGRHSRTHGISSSLLRLQAEAIGIPIMQRNCRWDNYEEEFKKAVSILKKDGIKTGVFGDIDIEEHRTWVERVCKDMKIKPLFPLWQKKREDVIREFISSGFKALIVAVKASVLDKEWIGHKINKELIRKLKSLTSVDVCGENGEYHSFVVSGPIFKKRLEIRNTDKIKKGKSWLLSIKKYELADKK